MTTVIEGPGYRITEFIAEFSEPYVFRADPDLAKAITNWLEFHGFDITTIPADTTIVRNVTRCYVAVESWVTRDNSEGGFRFESVHVPHTCRPTCHNVINHKDYDIEFVTYSKIEFNEGPPLPFPGFGFENFADRLQF